MSKETTKFVYVTYIRSTREKVFEALTRPDVCRRYWAHENVSDWKPGSKWEMVSTEEGRSVHIAGKVVEVSPPSRLVVTWARPGTEPAPPSRVTYAIEDMGEMIKLTVTHDELELGSKMATDISGGWPIVLSSLKSLLETGQGIDIPKLKAA